MVLCYLNFDIINVIYQHVSKIRVAVYSVTKNAAGGEGEQRKTYL